MKKKLTKKTPGQVFNMCLLIKIVEQFIFLKPHTTTFDEINMTILITSTADGVLHAEGLNHVIN